MCVKHEARVSGEEAEEKAVQRVRTGWMRVSRVGVGVIFDALFVFVVSGFGLLFGGGD